MPQLVDEKPALVHRIKNPGTSIAGFVDENHAQHPIFPPFSQILGGAGLRFRIASDYPAEIQDATMPPLRWSCPVGRFPAPETLEAPLSALGA